MNKLFSERPMSGFNVSIGTGLALEALFTPVIEVVEGDREPPAKIDVKAYDIFYLNAMTVLRNLISTMKTDELVKIPASEFYEVLEEELDFLSNLFEDNGLQSVIYLNTYTFFKKTYGDKLRKATTAKQLQIEMIMDHCAKKLKAAGRVVVTHKDVPGAKSDNALIFTHVPADLLSYSNFRNLDLLESHTGRLKSRQHWNSKYYPIPNHDMSFLPFMEYLLVTFGCNTMFKPAKMEERVKLYELMKKKNVNPLTSELSLSFILGSGT